MGIVLRQSFKATIVSYAGAVLGYINLLFLYPLCLTPQLVGFTRLFVEIATVIAWFSQLGLSSAIIRYFPLFHNPEKKHNGFLFYITIIPIIGFALFGIATVLFKTSIINYFAQDGTLITQYFYYVLPIAFFLLYTIVSESYSAVLMRIVVPRIAKEIVLRLAITVVILAYYFKWIDQDGLITGFVMGYGIVTIINICYILSIQNSSFKPQTDMLTRTNKKDIITYLLYIMLAGLGGNVVSKIDVFMISSKINLSETGVFSVAFFMAMVIELPSRSLLQILSPIASKTIQDNDIPKLNELYKKSSTNQMLFTSILFVLIWININNAFAIMPNGELYKSGVWVMFFIGLSKVFDAATGINIIIINNSKYYYFGLFAMVFLAINAIIFNIYLIPRYGITGAAIATATSIFLSNTMYVMFVWFKFKIQPFTNATLKTLVVAMLALGINYILPQFQNPFIDIFIRSSVVGIILLAAMYYWKISSDFNAFFNKFIKMRSIKDIQSL